jgi:glycosyltransferase involved in cell wall biosynthesis
MSERIFDRSSGARSLRILIVSDAWHPQVNGVVRTLSTVVRLLNEAGHTALVIGPDQFRTVPCPTYPDIRLALFPGPHLRRLIDAFRPDAMHIATEGPLGLAARALALRRGWQFSTAFHTRFPEYVQARIRLPASLSYAWLRRFHNAGEGIMVATTSLGEELARRGYNNIRAWSRGVDVDLFTPEPADPFEGLARPVFVCIGRVAVEKNIRAFLTLDLPGSKVVVGDGPLRAALQREFPDVHFTGARYGAALSASYAGADVFVFPSLTDTFGLVMLESLACGTPVAAFPVTGPRDVIAEAPVGRIDADLRRAALGALEVDRSLCRPFAERHSWEACTQLFLSHLVPVAGAKRFVPMPLPVLARQELAEAAD